MIIEKTTSEGWLSNTYLVADEPGGHAVVIDTGGPVEPIRAAIDAHRLEVTHVLCTHHHIDHVEHNELYRSEHGCPVCGHGAERELFGELDVELADGQEVESGGLVVRALHIPGHTQGQLAFLVNEERVFTGDTLFRRAVGGTQAPGHGTLDQLRDSIMERLLRLPAEMPVHPGHTEETTIGEEWEHNPFVRLWRGLDAPLERDCTVAGREALLLLEARDYDGGTKCLVRWSDGELDIVPGSRVKTGG
ncbi:MAG: MBL fold metallo-hydrolase [Planctomycetota bacterium]|nr:MBL fold metallo-hydrolase [Planctomycetota bacterium]MDP6761801.1 MBL fold metallo-hydrolase [Planctomycetota bacterium]MDP6987922.1 MBL fold metallo-hydrolase [Planctomycetota bacterium]